MGRDIQNEPSGSASLCLMSYLNPEKLPAGYSLIKRRAEKGYDKEKLPLRKNILTQQRPAVACPSRRFR